MHREHTVILEKQIVESVRLVITRHTQEVQNVANVDLGRTHPWKRYPLVPSARQVIRLKMRVLCVQHALLGNTLVLGTHTADFARQELMLRVKPIPIV